MTRCPLFCLIGCLLCLSASGPVTPIQAAAPTHGAEITPLVAQHLGAQTLAILAGAARVEAFRIGAPASGQSPPDRRIDDRPLSATGPTQGTACVTALTAALYDPRLYAAPHDRCLFHPGVVFRLWSGRSSVDCLLCFHCDDILILTRDGTGRVVHTEFAHFAPLRPALLALVQQTFPADQEIQRLAAK